MDSIPPIEIQKSFFHPICNNEEIERIFDVKNAKDYLLKLRAETIVDHMRLFRVYRNKALSAGKDWSLEKSFNGFHFINFKNSLPDDLKQKCDEITFGNVFSNEPNGLIFKSEYGIITTLSDSLRHFFEFMNLGLMNFGNKVPTHVRLNSIRIALRIMLQTEALDFLMDPRGIIPKDIQKRIYSTVPFQMQFIAGHEYAHYILNHISNSNTSQKHILKAIFNSQQDYKAIEVYNTSQKDEFDADVASLDLANYGVIEKRLVFEAALLWFAYLDLYEAVHDYIFPPIGIQSHPPARARYLNLLDKVKINWQFDFEYWTKKIPTMIDSYKDFFMDEVGFNIDMYEFYGSLYLDKPNTKWRGRELIDRVDYY